MIVGNFIPYIGSFKVIYFLNICHDCESLPQEFPDVLKVACKKVVNRKVALSILLLRKEIG